MSRMDEYMDDTFYDDESDDYGVTAEAELITAYLALQKSFQREKEDHQRTRTSLVAQTRELTKVQYEHSGIIQRLESQHKFDKEAAWSNGYNQGHANGLNSIDKDELEDMKRDAFDAGFSKGVEYAEKNMAHSPQRA